MGLLGRCDEVGLFVLVGILLLFYIVVMIVFRRCKIFLLCMGRCC